MDDVKKELEEQTPLILGEMTRPTLKGEPLRLLPDNLNLQLRLGGVYLAKGDASAARDIFRQVTDSFPHSDRAWASLGLLDAFTIGAESIAEQEDLIRRIANVRVPRAAAA